MAVPVPMAVRCFGHALVRRVEVQVGVRPERAALRELALLLRRVRVDRRACHGGARVSLMRRVERVWGGCGEGVGRAWWEGEAVRMRPPTAPKICCRMLKWSSTEQRLAKKTETAPRKQSGAGVA